MLVVVIVACVLGAVLLAIFLYGLRGPSNEEPAIGTNRPWPDGLGPFGPGTDEPPYSPTPVIGETEMFRRSAAARLRRKRRESQGARSWMEEPGAFLREGLYDAPEPSSAPPTADSTADRRQRRKRRE